MPVALGRTGGLWHYWKPVSSWRPQSLLANPGNPAVNPYSKKTSRDSSPTCTLYMQWKTRGQGRTEDYN